MSIYGSIFGGSSGASGGSADVTGAASSTDNAIVRFDSTTGKLIQDSSVTLSDVSASTVTAAVIAPTATTGASQVGRSLNIVASNAVASTDTAGAAAGGSTSVVAGAAARNASGNANGGNVVLTGGAGIGTGTAGQVVATNYGTAAKPGITFNGDTTTGIYGTSGSTYFAASGALSLAVGLNDIQMYRDTSHLRIGASGDCGVKRAAAGVIGITNGTTPSGGWIFAEGPKSLAAAYTNATTAMSNITGLSTTLITGRKYQFQMSLFVSTDVAADGIKIDFDGGTATALDFRSHTKVFDTALLLSSQTTAIATDIAQATITGDSVIEVSGTFEVNAAGTFIPRASQNAHTTGTLTIQRGSWIRFVDSSFS